MTDRETGKNRPEGAAGALPEDLELRAKPAPITRINHKVLFGVVFVGMLFLAGLVIVALNPPRFTAKSPSELYNVDQKAVTDALNKLPSSYEGVNVPRAAPRVAKGPTTTGPAVATPFGSIMQRSSSKPNAHASLAWPYRRASPASSLGCN